MQLSMIWLQATQNARVGRDAAEEIGEVGFEPQSPLQLQARNRSFIISSAMNSYIKFRGGDYHHPGSKFHFDASSEALITRAAINLNLLAEDDLLASITMPEREIARFLASTTWMSMEVSLFLIEVGRDREAQQWVRYIEDTEQTTEAPDTEESEELAHRQQRRESLKAREDIFHELTAVYATYTKIFDSIAGVLMLGDLPEDGTLERLKSFVDDILRQIEIFGNKMPIYDSIGVKSFADRTRADFKRKVMELYVILLTMMQQATRPESKIPFTDPIKKRLTMLEEYAIRNTGKNTALFASILIPELNTDI